MPEAHPAPIGGRVAPGFEPVRVAFETNFAGGGELGAAFAVMIQDEPVVDLWGGWADRARTRPWTAETIACVFSTTKPIAALALARLVEEEDLDFEATVASVWPDFAANGKGAVTIAQALSHQAGVPGFAEPIDPALWLDPPAMAAAIAALAPLWPPGTASGYHALTIGYVVNEIVRRASGQSPAQILREDICEPLGLDFWIGLPASEIARNAEMQKPSRPPDFGAPTPIKRATFLTPWAGPSRDTPEWRALAIPSANGHGTARAIARLYGAFANAGRVGDLRILGPGVFAGLSASRIEGEDLVLPARMEWAAGPMRNNNRLFGPNPQTLGHAGRGGSFGFGDPARGLSAAYVMNKQSAALLTDARGQALITALYACL
ncbi:MAG: serine hydrolase domain-containing protein [Hyphomonadaceae bacterium]